MAGKRASRGGRVDALSHTILPVGKVTDFRMRRQLLAPEVRGEGREGVLQALRVAQPAHAGLRWLKVRIHASAEETWNTLWDNRAIVRARLFHGTLGCILREDWDLYSTACASQTFAPLNDLCGSVLSSIERDQSVVIEQLELELNLPRPVLRQALIELGRRQLVLEAPEGVWSLVSPPDNRQFTSLAQLESRAEVIRRFLKVYGPAAGREIVDWSSWPRAWVERALSALSNNGAVSECTLESSPEVCYFRPEDEQAILEAPRLEPFVSILDCFDPLVRAQKADLKRQFGYGSSIPAYWHYVLVNGGWLGAMQVHWKESFLWICQLFLCEEVTSSPSLAGEVFASIRDLSHSIRIDNFNGVPASLSSDRDLLEHHGYQVDGDSYICNGA